MYEVSIRYLSMPSSTLFLTSQAVLNLLRSSGLCYTLSVLVSAHLGFQMKVCLVTLNRNADSMSRLGLTFSLISGIACSLCWRVLMFRARRSSASTRLLIVAAGQGRKEDNGGHCDIIREAHEVLFDYRFCLIR